MLPRSPSVAQSNGGQTRTYYIAADELDWDYAPSGIDQIHGEKYHFQDNPDSKGMLDPNATDLSQGPLSRVHRCDVWNLKPRSDAWAHLGALAPLIRAEVGDTINVVFKNHASRAYSIHPHGVVYRKDSEGAGYQDGSSDADKKDDAVAPGGTYTYAGRSRRRPARPPRRQHRASGCTTRTWMRAATSTQD